MNELYFTSFIIGLMGGVHCLGMCGAVVGVLSSNLPEKIRQNPTKTASYQLTYNIGRIFSYALMGLIFASFSYLLLDQIGMSILDKIMRIFAAIMMIFIGLFIAKIVDFITIIEKLGKGLWAKLQVFSNKFIPIKNYKQAFAFGLFWGGIPCGLVYSALALTIGTPPIDGFLIMLFFGLGTLPALLSIAGFGFGFARFLKQKLVQKAAGIIIIILGIWSLIMPIMSLIKN